MFRNYLTSTLRHLVRNRAYTFINVLGLAIGMACTILIYLYVDFEYSWDHFRPNASQVYRVLRKGPTPYSPVHKPFEGLSGQVGPSMVQDFPEVEETCRFRIGAKWARYKDFALRTHFWFADPDVLEFFGFKLDRGDAGTALTVPNGIILNPDIVTTYFGDEDPMGKTIEGQGQNYIVTGVLEAMPKNSMLQFNFLTSSIHQSERRWASWDDFKNGPRQRRTVTFVRLREGTDPKALESKLVSFARTILPESDRESQTYHLQAFTRMRMYPEVDFPGGIDGLSAGMGSANIAYVRTLMIIGSAVLLIACINFMNLATAQATKRAREVGVRKSVGAGRGQLALQFFGESVLLSLISLPVAWTIVQLLEPTWNSFIGSTTAINWTTRPAVPAGIGLIAIVIGLISGSYPAAYLSGFQPSLILRGLGSADGTGTVRKGLVILQFGISIVLVISTIVAWNQLTFVMHKDLGFDKENIITLSFFDVNSRLRKDYRDIKSRLASHPDVVNVFASASRPGEGWTRDRRQVESPKNPGMTFELNNYSVDESFFESLGIQLIDGRNFSPERASDYGSAFILNETAVQKLEFDDPIGKPFVWKDAEVAAGYGKATAKQGFIIGVVKDFHTRRLQEQIEPTAFVMEPGRFRIVSVKTRAGTLLSSMDHFENIWNQYITDRPLHYYFLDDRLEYGYRNERRYQQILAVSFGLAIFIACLGLTGLAAYTAERRTKEIGIRKVLGATSASIIALLCSEFVRIIALANLVAWPLAWYTMSAWLKGFAYRIDLTLLPFATAFVLSIAFALTMVGLQAYRAARTDPIDALRYE